MWTVAPAQDANFIDKLKEATLGCAAFLGKPGAHRTFVLMYIVEDLRDRDKGPFPIVSPSRRTSLTPLRGLIIIAISRLTIVCERCRTMLDKKYEVLVEVVNHDEGDNSETVQLHGKCLQEVLGMPPSMLHR
jgi:hypothetical protein